MTTELMIPDGPIPEVLSDPYHYANDEFVKNTIALKKEIARAMINLTPNQRYTVKETVKGVPQSDIAAELGVSASTISTSLKKTKVNAVLNMLMHYELMLDAPLEFQRKNMMWRIAVDNEKSKPKVAISAIDTLNKMTKTYATEQNGVGTVNIVINNANLPRGVLDQ